MPKSTADYLASGYSLAWSRSEPGVYVCGERVIRREDTTFGIRRAGNPMWSCYEAQIVETYPYDRPDAARRHAVAVGGFRAYVQTSYNTAEWRVYVTTGAYRARYRTLAEAKAYFEREARRG